MNHDLSSHLELRMFSNRSRVLILCCLVSMRMQLFAQEKQYYFFHSNAFGSDALFNPLSLLANGGWDTRQDIDRQLWSHPYWNTASTNVWQSVTSPFAIINNYGWSRFLRKEVIPINFTTDNAEGISNVMLHTIGGGMAYRKISEWYDYSRVPMPYLFGIITSVAYEFCNEVVENGPNYYPNIDCIPDMLFFQPLGIILFSLDGVSSFFSSTLNMNDWSEIAAVSLSPFAIRNAGQKFVMKLALNQNNSTSLFFHFGDFAILGLSFKTDAEYAISFGAGIASTGVKQLPIQNTVPSNTVTIGPTAGVYYDRNNSLLASIVYSDDWNTRLRMNIYPGILSRSSFSPGLFVALTGDSTPTIGLTIRILPLGVCF